MPIAGRDHYRNYKSCHQHCHRQLKQVIAGEPHFPAEKAIAATQSQAAYTNCSAGACRQQFLPWEKIIMYILEQAARLYYHFMCVNPGYFFHLGKVDHHTAIIAGEPFKAMTTALYTHLKIF